MPNQNGYRRDMPDDCDIRRPPAEWRVCELREHSGIGFTEPDRQQLVGKLQTADGSRPVNLADDLSDLDELSIEGGDYRIDRREPRPQLVLAENDANQRSPGTVRVHAGYHKCLTMLSRTMYLKLCKKMRRQGASFRHFYHRADHFGRLAGNYTIASVSGHTIDLDRYDDIRVVRFVRDPRDLLISGYFYHQRGKERWCHLPDPTDSDLAIVRGRVPDGFNPGENFIDFLNRVPVAEGLLAEMQFRSLHYASMLEWPDDPRVRVYRYEDIMGNEMEVFADIARFFGFSWRVQLHAKRYARRYRAGGKHLGAHVRNAKFGQWREHFTPEVEAAFERDYGALLDRYGYR